MFVNTFIFKRSLSLLLSNTIFKFSTSNCTNGTILKSTMNKNTQNMHKITQSLLTSSINYRFSTLNNQQQQKVPRYQKDPQLYHMNKDIQ